MAVTTSQVTTSANGDLALNPNGTGGVKFTKLATAAMPVGVKADGTVQHFKISELVATGTTLASTDTIMVQKTSETTTKKATLAEVLSGGGGLTASSLSVTTATTALDGGYLSYSNGVFTFTPADLSSVGGIALTDLSVAAGTAVAGGSLTYSGGVFTFGQSLDYTGTNGLAFVSGSTTQLEVNIISLTSR